MSDEQLLVQAIVEHAKVLGLKWILRPGSVTSFDAGTSTAQVILDGDDVPMNTINLLTLATVNARVMCLIIPHEAVYVIGLLRLGDINTRQVVLTANGTFSPSLYPYMSGVMVECWGGGGGGGGAALTAAGQCAVGGGGGSGGYARHIMQMRPTDADVNVVIGGGGAGGTAGPNTGSSGTSTTFDSTVVVATGGAGGEGSTASAAQGILQGGNPGTGTAGNTLQLSGSYGLDGYRGLNGTIGAAGAGGPAPFIGNLVRGNGTDAGGNGLGAPTNSASGGSGGHNTPSQATDKSGGAGADGLCLITILY